MIKDNWLFAFRGAIYNDLFDEAAELSKLFKDDFDSNQIIEDARKYHYGLDGKPINYRVAVALYEWAHNGIWFEDDEKLWSRAPRDAKIITRATLVDATSFFDWSDAAAKEREYESFFIGFDDESFYADSIIINAAMKGCPQTLGPAIDIYKKIKSRRESEILIWEGDLCFWSEADDFFGEIEQVFNVRFMEEELNSDN